MNFMHQILKDGVVMNNKFKNPSKENVLILTLVWDFGGTKIFLKQNVNVFFKNKNMFILEQYGDKFIITNLSNLNVTHQINANAEDLSKLIKILNIKSIFVNHLITFDLQLIMNWILNSKLPFDMFLHDYFCICANYNIDCFTKFCSENMDNPICRKYFSDPRVRLPNVSVENWRQVFHQFMSRASNIYTPSEYTANIIKKFYPDLNIKSKPHYLSLPLKKTFKRVFVEREKIRIVFLGHIYKNKGTEYLLLANEYVKQNHLPIEFLVLGIYDDDLQIGTKEGIKFLGKYDNEKISEILNELEVAIVATMSTLFETYCYTASEAILSGYPVIALNMGAHSLRIAKHDCGWLIPINSPSHGLEEFKHFLHFIVTDEGRQQILLKAKNTKKFKNGMD